MAVKNFAVVCDKIPLTGTAEELKGFSQTYNEVFNEFKSDLVEKYKQYKISYIHRYQGNFEDDMLKTSENIQNLADSMTNDKEELEDLLATKAEAREMMNRFLKMRLENFAMGVCWKGLKSYWMYKK